MYLPDVPSWSGEEESIIVEIQQAESVPRAEAIRRMQRRKKVSLLTMNSQVLPNTQRLCRNHGAGGVTMEVPDHWHI